MEPTNEYPDDNRAEASGYPRPPLQPPNPTEPTTTELSASPEKNDFNKWLIDLSNLLSQGVTEDTTTTFAIPEGIDTPAGTKFVEVRCQPTNKLFNPHPVKSAFWKYRPPSQKPSEWDAAKKASHYIQIVFKTSEAPLPTQNLSGRDIAETPNGYGFVKFPHSLPKAFDNLERPPGKSRGKDRYVVADSSDAIRNLALIAKAFAAHGGFPKK